MKSFKELMEKEELTRSDYKLSPSGRKTHKYITMNSAENEKEDKEEDEKKMKEVKEETEEQSDDRKKQLKKFKDLMTPGQSDCVTEALDTHEMATAHKDKASKSLETSDMKSYHAHMANHHESMGQWHESKGRHSAADREYAKSEEHHEKSLKPDNSRTVGAKNESTICPACAADPCICDDSHGFVENAPVAPSLGVHRVAVTTSEPDHPMVSKRKETTQRFVKVTTSSKERALEQGMKHFKKKGFKVHGAEHAGMMHEAVKETPTGRVHTKNDWEGYPSTFKDKEESKLKSPQDRHRMNKIIPPNDKMREEVELDEVLDPSMGAGEYIKDFQKSKAPQFKNKSKEKRRMMGIAAYLQAKRSVSEELKGKQHKLDKNKNGKLDADDFKKLRTEEEQMDEKISTAQMGHAGKTTIKHIDNPGVQLRMAAHDVKPGIKGYRDRIALLKAAQAQGKLKEDAEEIESIDEANHREFAQAGKMHPDMAKHMKTGQEMDFYHSKTGDKISGVVTKNTGTAVHVRANKGDKAGGGELHKFAVSKNLGGTMHEETEMPMTYKQFMEALWPGTAEYKKKFKDTERTTGAGARHDIKDTGKGVIATRRFSDNDTAAAPTKAAEPTEKRGRGRPAGSSGTSYKARTAEVAAAARAKAAATKAANKNK